MAQRITVVPNYGRDYKSIKEVKAAWAEGKDFRVADLFSGQDGRPINREDARNAGLVVSVRYDRLTKVVQVES